MNTNYFNIKKTLLLVIIIFIVLRGIEAILGNAIVFDSNLGVYFLMTMLYTFGLSYTNGSLSIAAAGKSEISIFGDPKIEIKKFGDEAVLYKKVMK